MSSLTAGGGVAGGAGVSGGVAGGSGADAASGQATVTATGNMEPAMVPRTANLLACKQWWRVCFLYGDQQKYYRQLYSKAAAQRLADANQDPDNGRDRDYDTVDCDLIAGQLDAAEDADDGIDLGDHGGTPRSGGGGGGGTAPSGRPLFPLSSSPRRSKKLLRSLRAHVRGEKSAKSTTNGCTNESSEMTQRNARVTVLDDPFLFGIDADHLGDLVVRGKRYSPLDATENMAKFYGEQEGATAQVLEIIEQEEDPPLNGAAARKLPSPPCRPSRSSSVLCRHCHHHRRIGLPRSRIRIGTPCLQHHKCPCNP